MAELDMMRWEPDGLLMGGDSPFLVGETFGLEDDAEFDPGGTDRQGDGTHPRRIRASDREVRLNWGLRKGTDIEAAVKALRLAMAPPTDRGSFKVFRWRHRDVTLRLLYRPATRPLMIPGSYENLVDDHLDATLTMWVPDPVIYTDAHTDTPFTVTSGSPDTETIVNPGSYPAVDGAPFGADLGAWRLTITAGPSGCRAPYMQHVGFPNEGWMLTDTFPPGSVATVAYDRVTRRGGVRRSATVKGLAGRPAALWPVLRPGNNQIRMGCAAGSFTAVLRHRGTR